MPPITGVTSPGPTTRPLDDLVEDTPLIAGRIGSPVDRDQVLGAGPLSLGVLDGDPNPGLESGHTNGHAHRDRGSTQRVSDVYVAEFADGGADLDAPLRALDQTARTEARRSAGVDLRQSPGSPPATVAETEGSCTCCLG
jgi:hypothetical protein